MCHHCFVYSFMVSNSYKTDAYFFLRSLTLHILKYNTSITFENAISLFSIRMGQTRMSSSHRRPKVGRPAHLARGRGTAGLSPSAGLRAVVEAPPAVDPGLDAARPPCTTSTGRLLLTPAAPIRQAVHASRESRPIRLHP